MDQITIGSPLNRIDQKTMADMVEVRLRDYLKENSLRPGDPLPKETELAERLGVSRNVVREALSRLRMLGIIESRRKRGMVVAQLDVAGSFERVLDPMFIGESTLREMFEFRLTLEMGLADLLFLRKRAEDIQELEKIAQAERQAPGDTGFRIKNEAAFHGKIYEMTGNPTMQRFQSLLLPIFGYLVALEKEPKVGRVSHIGLVELLRTGSKEEFRHGMYLHLEHHFENLR